MGEFNRQSGKDLLTPTEGFRWANQRAVLLRHQPTRRQLVVLGFLPTKERWAIAYWTDAPDVAVKLNPELAEYILVGPLGA